MAFTEQFDRIARALPSQTGDTGGTITDENGIERTVMRAYKDATTSGDAEVVAAQGASTRVRVIAAHVHAASAVTVKFRSATTQISGRADCAANGGFVWPRNTDGWCQTAVNEALNINLSDNVNVGVTVTWVQAA